MRYVTMEIPSALLGYRIDDNNTYLHPKPNDRKWFIGLFFIALSIIGFFCIRELKWLIMAYMFGTYIVLIAVPEVWFGVRLMLPIVPFLYMLILLSAFEGLSWLSKRINFNEKIRISVLPFIFLLFILVLKDGIPYLVNSAKGTMPPGYAQYFEIAKWAKANIPP